jgi:RteC protein
MDRALEVASMKKPFDALYAGMEKMLQGMGPELRGVDRYARGIELIRERIAEMQALGTKWIAGPEREVEYFRDVWPAFFGWLFLYVRLHKLELARLPLSREAWMAVIERERRRVSAFFRVHGEFWAYYRAGALDEQFTRAYSRSRIFDPLALVIDPAGATLASYRAARCIAMEGYAAWLAGELEEVAGPANPMSDYSWGAADTDFVEWLYGILSVEAIHYKGRPADLTRLIKWGRWALGKVVVNTSDRFKVLRNRKKEKLVFTKRTEGALERRIREADAQSK